MVLTLPSPPLPLPHSPLPPPPQMKRRYASKHPYGEWIKQNAVTMSTVMSSVPETSRRVPPIVQVGSRVWIRG